MSLRNRIERLEAMTGMDGEALPEVVIHFIEPVQDENGLMRPGRCTGGLRLLRGGGRQWLDADMQPVAGPA